MLIQEPKNRARAVVSPSEAIRQDLGAIARRLARELLRARKHRPHWALAERRVTQG